MEAPRVVAGAIQAAGHQRQHEEIEEQGAGGERERLPPRQPAEQQGEATHRHVDELTGGFRVLLLAGHAGRGSARVSADRQ